MKKLFFLSACLVALAAQPVMAQTSGADIVVVRLSFNGARLVTAIARGEGKTETTELDVPISPVKTTAPLAEAYQRVLVKLSREGYTLKGMTGGDSFTTIVFAKGQ
jgi:hypothetical protein